MPTVQVLNISSPATSFSQLVSFCQQYIPGTLHRPAGDYYLVGIDVEGSLWGPAFGFGYRAAFNDTIIFLILFNNGLNETVSRATINTLSNALPMDGHPWLQQNLALQQSWYGRLNTQFGIPITDGYLSISIDNNGIVHFDTYWTYVFDDIPAGEFQSGSSYLSIPSNTTVTPAEDPALFLVSNAVPEYFVSLEDAEGKVGRSSFCARDATAALELAQAIASRSDARWTCLRKISNVTVSTQDGSGNQINANFRQAATVDSDVQRKAVCIWATSGQPKIRLEVPAPKTSLVSKGRRTSSTDFFTSGERAKLLSKAGTPATALRGINFVPRSRR